MTHNTKNDFDLSLSVTYRPLTDLTPDPNNPRDHSPGQIRKLRSAIRSFGLVQPLLIDEAGMIIAGNARFTAATDLGMEAVPCIVLTHLSPSERRAYAIADNRIAEDGNWNMDRLRSEVCFLADQDLSFELETIGFETAELDFHLVSFEDDGLDDDPETDDLNLPADPVTQAGDLWLCGPHRVLCGDACSEDDVARVMNGERADMIFTDPPYNVPVNGHVRSGKAGHDEFVEASGEMTDDAFTDFLQRFMAASSAHSRDGALHYVCMDWRHMRHLLYAGHQVYTDLLNLCVWNKTNGGMGSFYRSKHELVFVWKAGKGPHTNNVQLGQHGRYRTNVWDYAGVNSFGAARDADLADHPTVKPTDMVMDAILDCTRRGEHVLDPFLGSGTTLLAAERSGRIAHGIEKDPRYVDVALRRWSAMTGDIPIHSETGQPWGAAPDHDGEVV